MKLYMLLLGCSPANRNTEQHDIFFGVASSLRDLIPDITAFWPEAKSSIHIDAWRVVNKVGDFHVRVVERIPSLLPGAEHLYFLNLGGYKEHHFDETHFKVLTVQESKADAMRYSKSTAFYKTDTFKGATSHIDDKYGLDVDDLHDIEDILPAGHKEKFALRFERNETAMPEDAIHLGYFRLNKLQPDW